LLESAAMKPARTVTVLTGTVALLLISAGGALAQTPVDVSETPAKNDSPLGPLGKLPSLAAILGGLGVLLVVLIVIRYMRFAPRFARDERSRVVRADGVQLGRELPRRNVDISKAAPVVVAPPAIPVAAGATAAPPATTTAPPPAPAVEGRPSTAAAPAAATPEAPAAAADAAPAAAAAAPASTAAAEPAASASDAPPAAPSTPSAPSGERQEVTMDQAVFDQTLQELLDAGTDRRVAEGRARRAGMMAAKKAAGEG